MNQHGPVVLPQSEFQKLFDALRAHGWETIAPRLRDGAIVLAPVDSVAELPVGWSDEQSEGRYRLRQSGDGRLFGYRVGPVSAKPFLHPARAEIWAGQRDLTNAPTSAKPRRKLALVGLRPCDLEAILKQDDVLLRGPYLDGTYAELRRNVFTVVVNCTEPGGTCFCDSVGTGPQAGRNYDLAITELLDDDGHRFLVQAGSRRGTALLHELPVHEAAAADLQALELWMEVARQRMGRHVETEGLREILIRQMEHPRWAEAAARCLGCGSCTSVCPTCFCVTTEDFVALDGSAARRERRWDSCFTLDYSYIHGGSVRQSAKSRYRHWVMHKFATWHDQFGKGGCVGCGRCITWCPAGIDITAELTAIRANPKPEEVLDGDH